MTCPLCNVVRQGRESPAFIAELPQTIAILGDNQGCRGWSILILKEHAEHLADLPHDRQLAIFSDVVRVAAAIRAVFPASGPGNAPPRLNYECLGNLVPHIHWHLIPRHADDPERARPVWGWPDSTLRGSLTPTDRAALARQLAAALR